MMKVSGYVVYNWNKFVCHKDMEENLTFRTGQVLWFYPTNRFRVINIVARRKLCLEKKERQSTDQLFFLLILWTQFIE